MNTLFLFGGGVGFIGKRYGLSPDHPTVGKDHLALRHCEGSKKKEGGKKTKEAVGRQTSESGHEAWTFQSHGLLWKTD